MSVTEREESRFFSRFFDSITERMVTDLLMHGFLSVLAFRSGIMNSTECEGPARHSNGDNLVSWRVIVRSSLCNWLGPGTVLCQAVLPSGPKAVWGHSLGSVVGQGHWIGYLDGCSHHLYSVFGWGWRLCSGQKGSLSGSPHWLCSAIGQGCWLGSLPG